MKDESNIISNIIIWNYMHFTVRRNSNWNNVRYRWYGNGIARVPHNDIRVLYNNRNDSS